MISDFAKYHKITEWICLLIRGSLVQAHPEAQTRPSHLCDAAFFVFTDFVYFTIWGQLVL